VHWVGSDTLEDEATVALLSNGDLLVYGLAGDGGVAAEIVVGPGLTPEEMAAGDNGAEPDDPGAVIEVPAGEYRLALYRKDWDAMQRARIADLEEAEQAGIRVRDHERVDEVIVLTPLEQDDLRPKGLNFLFKECVGL
jgi:hypothetical protein